MLAVRDRLEGGALVGLLADRGVRDDDRRMQLPFLGVPACFPKGRSAWRRCSGSRP